MQQDEDHPRLRGEYGICFPIYRYLVGSSPLARGILQSKTTRSFGSGIIPACAGNTFTEQSIHQLAWDHPRLRGEYCIDNNIVITS